MTLTMPRSLIYKRLRTILSVAVRRDLENSVRVRGSPPTLPGRMPVRAGPGQSVSEMSIESQRHKTLIRHNVPAEKMQAARRPVRSEESNRPKRSEGDKSNAWLSHPALVRAV